MDVTFSLEMILNDDVLLFALALHPKDHKASYKQHISLL